MLKSKGWRDQLLAQMVETMQAELAPALTQKVRDSVKDTVRYVQEKLSDSIRDFYSNSLQLKLSFTSPLCYCIKNCLSLILNIFMNYH